MAARTPMKDGPVSILVSSLAGGGAQRAMVMLAQGLAERGLPVDLVAFRGEGPFAREIPDAVTLVDLESRRVLTGIPSLVSYLRRARPRALISALDYVNVAAVIARGLARTGTPVIVTEQNTPSVLAQHTDDPSSRWVTSLIPHFYPRADRIIAVSEGVKKDLTGPYGIDPSRVDVIVHAVIGDRLEAEAREPLDDPWFAEGAPPVVVAVGRLSRQKDYPTMLRAFAAVRREREARLLILGEGPFRDETEACVRELGLEDDVRLPGFVENPYAVLSRAALFAMSSTCEGLPTVMIEALRCGAPIVSTDCPSGPREILEEGRYGRLVDVGDAPGLAAAMLAALAEGASEPPREAWLPYTVGVVAEHYHRLLDELASPAGA